MDNLAVLSLAKGSRAGFFAVAGVAALVDARLSPSGDAIRGGAATPSPLAARFFAG
jgi:hypothetical protein